MKGYWNKPEATAETFRDGWLHTGDIGRIDDEGFVYIVDRAKDMLIRGGENVYCVEVEDVLYEHPAVIGRRGDRHPAPRARRGGRRRRAAASRARASPRRSCARYAASTSPRSRCRCGSELRDEPLPRNPNGKILKRELREELGLT